MTKGRAGPNLKHGPQLQDPALVMNLLLLTLIGVIGPAGPSRASVGGTVRDEATGRAIVGAVVSLPDLRVATTTDSTGRYRVDDLAAGPNHLVVRFIGYAPRTIHVLIPSAGHFELNVTLRATATKLKTLVVRGGPALRGLDRADSSATDRIVSMAAARNHPLLAEPDPFLALSGGPVSVEPESPSGVHVRGGASDHTAYQVDGIPVLSPYHTAGLFGALNPDALSSVRLTSTSRTADQPDALAGVISATTLPTGPRHQAQGSLSMTQARLTMNGPIGSQGAGYLASVRSGFPSAFAPADGAHLRGESGDWLVKLETPVAGGRLTILGTGSDNEIGAATRTDPAAQDDPSLPRHEFEWRNRSLGLSWQRSGGAGTSTRLSTWSAQSQAAATWRNPAAPLGLQAARNDLGLMITTERPGAGGTITGGIRIENRRTEYHTAGDSSEPASDAVGSTPLATGFASHRHALADGLALTLGGSVLLVRREVLVNPSAALQWRPTRELAVTANYGRFRQLAQSARNSESVVDRIFPSELYVSGGLPGIPVARSDQAVLTVDYRPTPAARFTAEAFHRTQQGLLLAAPRDNRPFSGRGLEIGAGVARGGSIEAAVSSARVGVLLSYAIERVSLTHGDTSYIPSYGATHRLEGGLTLFPGAASSIRLGVAGAWGRRSTAVAGGFEWETCNLVDRGCEFAGSPIASGRLGGTRLPAYVRIDLGLRHHWDLSLGGRNVQVALFGSMTNLLGRKNLLTYATDPLTGQIIPIEMRPFAPLVVGLDWRF